MPFGSHTLLLTDEGVLMAFGSNCAGQLGLGHCETQRKPGEVPWEGPRLVQVDWGYFHSLLLDEEGCVWEAGRDKSNYHFQRVVGLPQVLLVAAGFHHCAALDCDGVLWVWADRSSVPWASPEPKKMEGLPPVLKVACGWSFLAVETEDDLFVLGNNAKGQLGLGHTNRVDQFIPLNIPGLPKGPLRQLAAQSLGILIIDSQGTIWTAGENYNGQLGRNGDGLVFQMVTGLPPMLKASCGCNHTLAIDETGSVWAWGLGAFGQLGLGSIISCHQPSIVVPLEGTCSIINGDDHSLAIFPDGSLLVFGENSERQLGLPNKSLQLIPTLSPFRVSLPPCPSNRSKSARSTLQALSEHHSLLTVSSSATIAPRTC